jgi:hypothetical protein
MDALFFFDDETEARFYAGSDGRHFSMMAYEIELLDPGTAQHVGDWRNAEYWQGVFLPPHPDPAWPMACREVLAVSRARILRRI